MPKNTRWPEVTTVPRLRMESGMGGTITLAFTCW